MKKDILPAPRVLSPAGSFESLRAAMQGGADAVYFGVGKLNMRSRSAKNFTIEDLDEIVAICREHNTLSYLTLNTIIYDEELAEMRHIVDRAKEAGVSAIIASDMSVMQYARQQGVRVHISTQCNITNLESVRAYAHYADVMVLARELNLRQVHDLVKGIEREQITGPSGELIAIEIFVHGALCMAVSGKCYLSLDNMNFSANRGACLQLCRRSYLVTDKEEGYELEVDHQYIMSPKDLCTIGFLDKIIHTGAAILKIEGRGRSADYVKTTTRCYKEAVQAVLDGTYSREMVEAWTQRLETVFNRGFWDGYYLGRRMGEWADRYGSQATRRKQYVGKVTNYFSKLGVAEITLETRELAAGTELMITGPTTGVVELVATEIRLSDKAVAQVRKGDVCSVKVAEAVRRGDKVFSMITETDPY
ncbi:MAG: peptidase U32 family protein [Bacteroidales bacterium]|nr:peptidase U32 family protein [Bacteroidales bacterium]